MNREDKIIHLVDRYVGGLPHTNCGIYTDSHSVSAFPRSVTCKRCIGTLSDFIRAKLLREVMES
jgi:hypothetical protein